MSKIILNMSMSLDGFFAGPNGELDWLSSAPDEALNKDVLAFFERIDAGFVGYSTGVGMIPYWQHVAQDATASKESRALANAVSKLHAVLVSQKQETEIPDAASLLIAENDEQLREKVGAIKQQSGKDLAISGGIRLAQTFTRLGLVDEYQLTIHPVVLGQGQRVFTEKLKLQCVTSKLYGSGVVRATYRSAA